ncbi:hypothetical protein vseg_005915 [Gypsophila vaccaria]
MFTNDIRQAQRTGKHGTTRHDHLQDLVTQFQDPTATQTTKLKLLSNLANFAYDPYNSAVLRRLNVLELFIDHLDDADTRISAFSAAGICNAAADPDNAASILRSGGVSALVALLVGSTEGSAVESVIASLFYLCENGGGVVLEEVRTAEVVAVVEKVAAEGGGVGRNVARVLLDKYLNE